MRFILKIISLVMIFVSITNFAHIYHQTKSYDRVGYCCYREDGTFVPQQTIRWADDFADEWPRRGVTNEGIVGFADMSEQPLISGFERSAYNTPK
ncbi:MAG: hypothetical protein AMXMBFR12_00120 [Candidatus Babeliales bacterium]